MSRSIGDVEYDATSDPHNPGWVVWTGDPEEDWGAGWQPVDAGGPDEPPSAAEIEGIVNYHYHHRGVLDPADRDAEWPGWEFDLDLSAAEIERAVDEIEHTVDYHRGLGHA